MEFLNYFDFSHPLAFKDMRCLQQHLLDSSTLINMDLAWPFKISFCFSKYPSVSNTLLFRQASLNLDVEVESANYLQMVTVIASHYLPMEEKFHHLHLSHHLPYIHYHITFEVSKLDLIIPFFSMQTLVLLQKV